MSANCINPSGVAIQYQDGQLAADGRHQRTSFLSLPIELRTAIYEFLVPDGHVHSYWFVPKGGGPPDKRPVRFDKEPCCPAILSTNRQIYTEVIGMFYGTARFSLHVVGSICYFLGMKYGAESLDLDIPSALPSTFRLIRSISISISFILHWTLDEPPSVDSNLPPLPMPQPGTALIEECLKLGPNNLRQVDFHEVMTPRRRLPWVVHTVLQDRGRQFKVTLERFLEPLRILSAVKLNFDNVPKIRPQYPEILGLNPQLSSNDDARAILNQILKIRNRALRELAKHVAQHN